jgi:glycosidase
LNLRKRNPALATDASFKKIDAGDNKALYAYVKEKAGHKILVILNLSSAEQPVTVKDKSLWGKPYNVFMGTTEPLNGNEWKIEPWGYVVYEYKSGNK